MPRANVFQWHAGAGWLILAGGGAGSGTVGEVETLALGKATPGEPIAYIHAAGDVETADQHLAALEDAGAPTGYLVDVQTEDDDTLREQLAQAGLIIVGDGPNPGALRNGLVGAALDGIGEAFGRGSSILAIGAGASVFGQKFRSGEQLRDGLGWLQRAIILPDYAPERDAPTMRALLIQYPDSFGLGIGVDSALAFGSGSGEVEAWGTRQLSLMIGAALLPDSIRR
ncbi:MAG: type 1 glutamine amidotransferase family protein [Aggregatilineales bacterium]